MTARDDEQPGCVFNLVVLVISLFAAIFGLMLLLSMIFPGCF